MIFINICLFRNRDLSVLPVPDTQWHVHVTFRRFNLHESKCGLSWRRRILRDWNLRKEHWRRPRISKAETSLTCWVSYLHPKCLPQAPKFFSCQEREDHPHWVSSHGGRCKRGERRVFGISFYKLSYTYVLRGGKLGNRKVLKKSGYWWKMKRVRKWKKTINTHKNERVMQNEKKEGERKDGTRWR